MTDHTHIADDILYLAHQQHARMVRPPRNLPASPGTRSPSLPKEGFGVLYRVCQPDAHDQFIEAKA